MTTNNNAAPPPNLLDFLSTTPAPVLTVLVSLRPQIAALRQFAEALSWTPQAGWAQSWLLVAAWWAICLLSSPFLRYAVPLAVLCIFTFRYRRAKVSHPTTLASAKPAAVTEDDLQATIADLTALHSLLPTLPALPLVEPYPLLRATAILYVPYVVITAYIRLRVLLAMSGTLILVHRAAWARSLRNALWHSAHVRWTLYSTYGLLSGQPAPSLAHHRQQRPTPTSRLSFFASSTSSTPSAAASVAPSEPAISAAQPIRFLFSVYENQRWWMGLDWTAALLPGERPSWCSAAQAPVPPPSALPLPSPSTVYTKAAGKESAGKRIKRTARWEWAEREWRVSVRTEANGGRSSRAERPLPEEPAPSGGALAKAAAAMKGHVKTDSVDTKKAAVPQDAQTDAKAVRTETSAEDAAQGDESHVEHAPSSQNDAEEPFTDTDGWIYGDNKWEGGSSKGGLGKYTRYRRWTRIAVLREEVELVDASEAEEALFGSSAQRVSTSDPPPAYNASSDAGPPPSPSRARRPTLSGIGEAIRKTASGAVVTPASAGPDDASAKGGVGREESVKQRLKAAVSSKVGS